MPKQKQSGSYDLIVVAHPDDEAIFMGGLIQKFKNWKVICVTDGNADGMGPQRHQQFGLALKTLGVHDFEIWDFKDIYEKRLSVESVVSRLLRLPRPRRVFTHGILGEYGHPHHQDVSVACHRAFLGASTRVEVWSAAYNCFPQMVVELSKKQFEVKSKVLSQIYFSETKKFSQFLPLSFSEGFTKVSLKETSAIYDYWTQGRVPKPSELKIYKWYWPYLEFMGKESPPRPF